MLILLPQHLAQCLEPSVYTEGTSLYSVLRFLEGDAYQITDDLQKFWIYQFSLFSVVVFYFISKLKTFYILDTDLNTTLKIFI